MSNKPQYRLLEFGLSKKPWYRILIVNFYTELENYINFESTFVGDEIHPIKKEIIRIRNRKNFFFFFQIQFFIYLLFQNSPENPISFFNGGLMFRLMNRFSLFFTLLYLTLSCFLNLSFGFLFFYLESAFKTKKKRKSFSIPNNFLVISCFWSHIIKEGKDYYSLDLGQENFKNFLFWNVLILFHMYRGLLLLQPFRKIQTTFSHRKNRHIPQLTQKKMGKNK
ncbi:hypothetical protein ACJX0J_005021 [Zea mays]